MSKSIHERRAALDQRRKELLSRIALQREQLVDQFESRWKTPLTIADQGISAVRYVRDHPMIVAMFAALVFVRRRSLVGAGWGVWRVWKMYRDLTSIPSK